MNTQLKVNDILNSIKGDLGEEDYLEPLEVLVESLNTEANLSYLGSLGAKFQITNHLQTRAKYLITLARMNYNSRLPPYL